MKRRDLIRRIEQAGCELIRHGGKRDWYWNLANRFFTSAISEAFAYDMKGEFTALIEAAPEGGYWAVCPEVPGANGQGETPEEAKESLKQSIELILQDRTEDALRGLPDEVVREKVIIE